MNPVTEKELIEKSKAPRVTLDNLESNIKAEYAFNLYNALEVLGLPVLEELKTMTIGALVLQNGFIVLGESACADPTNFDQDIGNRLAITKAKNQIWPLMGYALKQELFITDDNSFINRMGREIRELQDKIAKLEIFIAGETFKSLDQNEQGLMKTQKMLMTGYAEALQKRMDLHNSL